MKPRYVHVASWNIEHFGRNDDNSENQFAIAEHIEMSGAHVLALQEIYATNVITDPGARPENSFLRAALDLIEEHTGQHWELELFRNRSLSDTSQLCGVVWNESRVRKEGQTLRLGVPHTGTENGQTFNLWDRHPHAVKFRAVPGEDAALQLTDFVLVPLHMKANTGHRPTVMKTRELEARSLVEQFPAIQANFGEKDIVLLGDTNCTARTEPAIEAFIDGGLADLNADDIPTFVAGSDAPFDRIFVPSDPERKAFRFSRQYILRSASPLSHDRFLSDHYLIKTTVIVRRDEGD